MSILRHSAVLFTYAGLSPSIDIMLVKLFIQRLKILSNHFITLKGP